MYLYFEDWSAFIPDLDKKNIPHNGKIIKVFASTVDPRIHFSDPGLKVVPILPRSLDQKVFRYGNDRFFPGTEIEDYLLEVGLNELAKGIVRALLLFADTLGIWQGDMGVRVACRHLINHPLDKIDGLYKAVQDPDGRSPVIHLDIFTAPSLQQLKAVVDYENDLMLVPSREGAQFKAVSCSLTEGHR